MSPSSSRSATGGWRPSPAGPRTPSLAALRVAGLDGKAQARRGDHRRALQQPRQRGAIQRGGHHQDPQVGRQVALGIQDEGEAGIGLQAALVELVEDHQADAIQRRVPLQLAGEDALGDHLDPRARPHAGVEAHAIAHRVARVLAELCWPCARPRPGPPAAAARAAGCAGRRATARRAVPAGTPVLLPAPGGASQHGAPARTPAPRPARAAPPAMGREFPGPFIGAQSSTIAAACSCIPNSIPSRCASARWPCAGMASPTWWALRRPGTWASGAPPARTRRSRRCRWTTSSSTRPWASSWAAASATCCSTASTRSSTNPLNLFRIWEGGMSFHGGLLGVLAAMWLYARRLGRGFFQLTDFVAPLVPIGLGAGRIGNFINGELWGAPTTVPWAFIVRGRGAAPVAALRGGPRGPGPVPDPLAVFLPARARPCPCRRCS